MPQTLINRRRVLAMAAWASVASVAAGLSACAGLGGERSFRVDEAELQALLEKNFPVDRKLLELFDVTLKAPRVRLLPETNRVAAELELASSDRLLGRLLSGRLAFDAQLRIEPSDNSLRLAQVRVQQFTLGSGQGAGNERGLPLDRIGSAVAERVLEGLAVYTLPPERAARLRQLGLAPQAVAVTRGALEVTLAPTAAAPR
jgi:hypothetical protein